MSRPGFRFRPARWPTIAFLLLLPLFLGLGFWQLDRAEQKRELIQQIRQAADADPLPIHEAMEDYHDGTRVRVEARGRFDSQRQFLLDNQIEDSRVGYRVLTPLRLNGSETALLVDLGWRPAPASRDQLPAIDTPDGARRIDGVLGPGPATGVRLGEALEGVEPDWPRRIQYVDYEALEAVLPYALFPAVLETEARLEGLTAFGPERHLGYAVQWFALGLALLVLYLVLNLRRIQRDD